MSKIRTIAKTKYQLQLEKDIRRFTNQLKYRDKKIKEIKQPKNIDTSKMDKEMSIWYKEFNEIMKDERI